MRDHLYPGANSFYYAILHPSHSLAKVQYFYKQACQLNALTLFLLKNFIESSLLHNAKNIWTEVT